MASSKVMDLPRESCSILTVSELQTDQSKNLGMGSMNLDELLKNIYGDNADEVPKNVVSKTVDEVWKDIVSGRDANPDPEVTLEDFLTKAGAVSEDEIMLMTNAAQFQPQFGRGKRKMMVERPLDKATQQKQRRMIKNRESAARSRERKQAYNVELESLVMQLEEENAMLLREETEKTKERFKKLSVNLIPVVEKQKPPRVLRRMHSM